MLPRWSKEQSGMADNNAWHIADRGQSIGPMTLDDLVARLPQHGGEAALVYGPGLGAWTAAGPVEAVRARLRPPAFPPAPPPSVAPQPPAAPSSSESVDSGSAFSGGGYGGGFSGVPGGGVTSPGGSSAPPPAARASAFAKPRSDSIDYKIHGSEMQFVEVTLDPGE